MKNLFFFIGCRALITLIFCATSGSLKAQSTTEAVISDSTISASFPGGILALFKFIQDSVKYSKSALNYTIKQKVGVQIKVEKDGVVSNVITPPGLRKDFEQEVHRVISLMPKWSPALKNGQPITSTVFFNISFVTPK